MHNINSYDYWSFFVNFVSPEFDSGIVDLVIRPNKFLSFENGVFTLIAPNETIKKLINSQFKSKLEILMSAESGQKVSINAVLSENNAQTNHVAPNNTQQPTTNSLNDPQQEIKVQNNFDVTGGFKTSENVMSALQNKYKNIYKPEEKFVFESFVVGESNKIAKSAAEQFLNSPDKNVLFLYGSSGLGKTHLISAVGNRALSEGKKIAYMQANEFVQQYTGALGHFTTLGDGPRTIEEFVSLLNSVDVLIIDDIQGFNGKTESSGTFFNIFNHLKKNNKKIILAADLPPESLAGIPERLITRFNQGLVLKVLKPSTELAVKFLASKTTSVFIETPDLEVSEDVYDTLALHFGSDFRTLEGIINKLNFYTTIQPTKLITVEYLKKHVLSDVVTQKKIQGGKIKRVVSEAYNLPDESYLAGKARKTAIASARHLAIYFFRKHLDLSFKQIGSFFGDRDHSTIMHSEGFVKKKIEEDSAYKEFVLGLEKKIKL